jgi:MoaA/NifB/PqqE/SkfB family radical SAM enzyme
MLSLDNVIIEITRRCNMKCEHCLRGAQQRLDIPDDVLSKFFLRIRDSYINHLCLTGGEPSLAP